MLRKRVDATVYRLSICLSVRDIEVCFSRSLKYFENNFTADLKVSAQIDPNMGDLVQQEHPQS